MPDALEHGVMRVGRIAYRNVLPIYHPLEQGLLPHNMRFVYGPPAALNKRMQAGELDLASVSSIEYARRSDRYLLLPDLAIGSNGPVQSVLLLSSLPVEQLGGKEILVSAETHTSAMLLKLLLEKYWQVPARLVAGSGSAMAALAKSGERPVAVLAIGDEALALRQSSDYEHLIDLGEVWREWTGLPFVFGVWVMRRELGETSAPAAAAACRLLLQGKAWGQQHIESLLPLTGRGIGLDTDALRRYFQGLSYDLGPAEQQGLRTFFAFLAGAGLLQEEPELRFFHLENCPGAHAPTENSHA